MSETTYTITEWWPLGPVTGPPMGISEYFDWLHAWRADFRERGTWATVAIWTDGRVEDVRVEYWGG